MPDALVSIGLLIVAVFAWEFGKRWWRENEWKRQWKRRQDGTDEDED